MFAATARLYTNRDYGANRTIGTFMAKLAILGKHCSTSLEYHLLCDISGLLIDLFSPSSSKTGLVAAFNCYAYLCHIKSRKILDGGFSCCPKVQSNNKEQSKWTSFLLGTWIYTTLS